jgi:hypothetical protein
VAPPTSQSVWNLEKSNLPANASFDGCEQNLGMPKAESALQDAGRIKFGTHNSGIGMKVVLVPTIHFNDHVYRVFET